MLPITHGTNDNDSNFGFLEPKETSSLVEPTSEIVCSSEFGTSLSIKLIMCRTRSPLLSWARLRNIKDSWTACGGRRGPSGANPGPIRKLEVAVFCPALCPVFWWRLTLAPASRSSSGVLAAAWDAVCGICSNMAVGEDGSSVDAKGRYVFLGGGGGGLGPQRGGSSVKVSTKRGGPYLM